MKKIMLSLGLMLAALTLTNCSNEIDENINANTDGVAFELTAAIDGDRTATDGFKTNWVAGDQINLFHAAAGTTTYVNDNAFKVDDAAAGHFVGTLKEDLTAEAHDWYALYPFDTNYTTPNGTRYYKLWAQSQAVEANSTEHVVGKNGPLYGVATEVATGDPVKVKMHHLGTLLKVKVGNEAEDFTIESIKIEAAQSYLTGSFYVGFDSTGITKMTMSGASYANKDVTLTCDTFVEVGTDGNDLCFYAAVAPFTAPAGEKLTITITTDKGVATIVKNVPEGTEFKAGVVNSLNVYIEELGEAEEIQKLTAAEFNALANLAGPYILQGTVENVSNTQYGNFYLTDATGSVYVYGLSSPEGVTQYWSKSGVKAGDCLTVQATRGDYISNGETVSKQAKNAIYVSHYGITVTTPAEVAAAGGSAESTVTLPTPAVDGASVSVSVNDSSKAFATANYSDGKVVVTFAKNEGVNREAIITVNYGMAKASFTVLQAAGAAAPTTKTATITFDNKNKRTSYSTSAQVWKENGIVVTNNKKSSTSNVGDYSNPARFYKSSEFILEAPGNITKLVFTCAGESKYYLTLSEGTNYTVTGSGSSTVTVEFTTASSNTFTIASLANQARISKIAVTYMESGESGDEPAEPVQLVMSDVTCSNAGQSENSLTFTWTAVENASGYEVYFDSVSKGTVTTTSYTASDLAAGSEHVIAVKAVGDGTNYTTSEAKTCTASTKAASADDDNTGSTSTKSVTLSGSFTSANSQLTLTTEDGLTVTQYKQSGNTAVNATYGTATTLRVYKGHALKFSGKTITKIEIVCNGSYFGNSLTANVGTLATSYTSGGTHVWTGESDEVIISNTGTASNVQLRPSKIIVTYAN